MRALAIAASGMTAQQLNVEVIAHNIANINTTGFKRGKAEFTDLLYQADRTAGAPNRGGEEAIPEGAQIGLGVRAAAVRQLHLQGSLTKTSNTLDVALDGRGWLQVTGPNGEAFYTRQGALNKNATGQIVTADGYALAPQIVIPATATRIQINQAGEVFADADGGGELTQIGQITLATFVNDAGLEAMGGSLFRETSSSGAPTIAVAGSQGVAKIHQGYLENANVDPVKEITELITAQRSYEMNSKVIEAVDGMYATVAKGIR
ncbi:MAG: flagellar basal-body rod protein FlgG [Hyphomicrobiales bacterium]|nr:flagellar basal-body rod protein FlgG [Hyphomicrobiales bacterium]